AAGSTQTVQWTSANLTRNVKLDYSTDGGSTWRPIAASAPNTGSAAWTVPATATSRARVRVSAVSGPGASDSSAGNFTITVPPPSGVHVTAPNGGETSKVGTYQTVRWTTSNAGTSVKIELSRDGGRTWATLAASTRNS